MSHRCLSPTYVEQPRAKLSYRERYESEHTYATNQGGRHFKERQAPSPPALAEEGSVIPASPQPETDLDYESDFEVDREPVSIGSDKGKSRGLPVEEQEDMEKRGSREEPGSDDCHKGHMLEQNSCEVK